MSNRRVEVQKQKRFEQAKSSVESVSQILNVAKVGDLSVQDLLNASNLLLQAAAELHRIDGMQICEYHLIP